MSPFNVELSTFCVIQKITNTSSPSNTMILFFFKQKTAYEMRISDWSSDVCSSDLRYGRGRHRLRWQAVARCRPLRSYGRRRPCRGDRPYSLGAHPRADWDALETG